MHPNSREDASVRRRGPNRGVRLAVAGGAGGLGRGHRRPRPRGLGQRQRWEPAAARRVDGGLRHTDNAGAYNKVGVFKVGPGNAKNVLVLEPGTSAGSAYFVPLAKWIVAKTPGWQVWSVERRENLLEDQSELNLFKDGKATATQLFNYYLGYLKNPSDHAPLPAGPDSTVEFAKRWGMNVAVQDLHTVIAPPRSWAARSSSAGTPSAAAWSPPTPPGTSTGTPAPTTWPAWSTSTGAARPARRRAHTATPSCQALERPRPPPG